MSGNRWLQMIEENPGHSAWYIERFRTMAADGADLDGEARLLDAMVPRGARILDAGCGPGRVGGRLARLGHTVVGVDLDPELITAARADHPVATWMAADLATLDPAEPWLGGGFHAVVCAGNVMTFLDPATRPAVLATIAGVLVEGGRAVIGFGANRGYPFEEFLDDAARAGLREHLLLSSWDLQPLGPTSDFLVAVLSV